MWESRTKDHEAFAFLRVPIVLASILLGFSVKSTAQSVPEFAISDSGGLPAAASDLNGGVYVTWTNLNDAVHLAHLDSLGSPTTRSLGFTDTYACLSPRIAANQDNVAVVWEDRISNNITFFKTYISGCIVRNIPGDTGSYLMFNDNSVADYVRGAPDVSFLNDTTFLVVWDGNGDSTPVVRSGIYGQLASMSGNKIGGNFLVTDHFGGSTDNYIPRVISCRCNGSFFVTWEDNSSGRYNLYGRKFDMTGAPMDSSFLISDDSAMTYMFYYCMAQDTGGSFVVVWIAEKGSESQLEWRWYDNRGTPLTNVEELTPLDTLFGAGNATGVSIDSDGRTVLFWEQETTDGFKIFGRRYLPDRTPLGNAFRISADNTLSEEYYPNVILRKGILWTIWQRDTVGYISTGIRGRILYFDSITSVVNHSVSAHPPETFFLYQNYPNPFNPNTVIKYQLPVNSFVTLKVYDVLGRQLQTLVNERQTAGSHNVTFNASKLPSGIYFYRLQAGTFTQVKKMILMK